jgi:hypothetical protein
VLRSKPCSSSSPREMIALGRKGAEKFSMVAIDLRARHHTGHFVRWLGTDGSIAGRGVIQGHRAGWRSQGKAPPRLLELARRPRTRPDAIGCEGSRKTRRSAWKNSRRRPWSLGARAGVGQSFTAKHGQQVRRRRRSGMLQAGLARMLASAPSNTSVAGARPECATSAVSAAAALPFAAFVRGYFSGVFTTSYWRWRWMTAEARCS